MDSYILMTFVPGKEIEIKTEDENLSLLEIIENLSVFKRLKWFINLKEKD